MSQLQVGVMSTPPVDVVDSPTKRQVRDVEVRPVPEVIQKFPREARVGAG